MPNRKKLVKNRNSNAKQYNVKCRPISTEDTCSFYWYLVEKKVFSCRLQVLTVCEFMQ